MKTYEKSKALFERACQVLAGGVSSEFRKLSQPHPLFFSHGYGSHIVDVDGNDYLDFTLSQGPLILGHSHPEVLEAVAESSKHGQLFAGQHLQELELAETIQRLVPSAELMRFSLDGSEAVHAALRTARAITGRSKFIRFEGHYHGWLDNVSFGVSGASVEALVPYEHPYSLPWSKGLPPQAVNEHILLPWNNLDLLERVVSERYEDIAAIITEPVMCNNGCIPPKPGFLEGMRDLCDRYGIALIFDEVITGFRLGMSGAQGYFTLQPDLTIFAKAIANGYGLSVLAGKQKWLQPVAEGKVIHAGTMNSSNATVAAALTTIKMLERDNLHAQLFHLGERLMDGLRKAAKETSQDVLVQGLGPMFHLGFTNKTAVYDYRDTLSYDKAKGAAFIRGMQEEGIRLIGRGLWYLSAAHSHDDVDAAINAAQNVLKAMTREFVT
jgi:glutamate-1-semialdehyde 2,1-aminomutase